MAWCGRRGCEAAARRGRCGAAARRGDAGLRRGGLGCGTVARPGRMRGSGVAEGGRRAGGRGTWRAVAGVRAGALCGRVQVAAVGISVRSAGCGPGNLWKMRCDTPRLRDTKCYKAVAKGINKRLSVMERRGTDAAQYGGLRSLRATSDTPHRRLAVSPFCSCSASSGPSGRSSAAGREA